MTQPQMEPQTIERLKAIMADQLLIIDQQAQYIQALIAWGQAAHDKVAESKNGVKAKA